MFPKGAFPIKADVIAKSNLYPTRKRSELWAYRCDLNLYNNKVGAVCVGWMERRRKGSSMNDKKKKDGTEREG